VHDAFDTLSTFGSSNDRHGLSGHFTCALRLTFNPRRHVNHFVDSSYPRPPPRNLLEGGFTFVTLLPQYALCFPKDESMADVIRGSWSGYGRVGGFRSRLTKGKECAWTTSTQESSGDFNGGQSVTFCEGSLSSLITT